MNKLIKKQEEEIDNILMEYNGNWHKEDEDGTCETFTMADLKSIIAKVRRETAERVCSEMDIIDREERKQKREQIIENL